MSVEKHAGNGTFVALYYAMFCTPSFRKSLKFFGTSIISLDPDSRNSPTTGILHSIRHVYRSVWPAGEAKPRFGPRSNVLRMIVKLARWFDDLESWPTVTYIVSVPQFESVHPGLASEFKKKSLKSYLELSTAGRGKLLAKTGKLEKNLNLFIQKYLH